MLMTESGTDKIRKSREYQICIDPDEQRLIEAMLRLIEDLQRQVAALRPQTESAEPVAWRIRVRQDYATFYSYTERLPFEPDEDCKITILSEPEPLYAADESIKRGGKL